MGKTYSKSVSNAGDPQVFVENKLNIHEEYHQEHELKLMIILCLVAAQLMITLYQIYKRHSRAQAIKLARSEANISHA